METFSMLYVQKRFANIQKGVYTTMKKIITLVLALVMVFAIAAPALALTDAPLSTTTTSGRFTLAGQLAAGPAEWGSTLTIPAVAVDKAWVANELVYYVFRIAALAAYPATAPQPGEAAYDDVALRISANGVDIVGVGGAYALLHRELAQGPGGIWVPVTGIIGDPIVNNGALIYPDLSTLTPLTATANGNYIVSGVGRVTGTVGDASISAFIGILAMTAGNIYKGVPSASYPAVTIFKTEPNNYTVNFGAFYLRFVMNASSHKCDKIIMSVYDAAAGAWGPEEIVTYGDGIGNTVTPGNAYGAAYDYEFNGLWNAAKKAMFLGGMSYLGFDYSKVNTNAVLERHFIAKIYAPSLSVTLNVPLYTAAVTVPTQNVPAIPKTGDAASILGFVLIAAAIVAAAAVAYRKVRA